MFKVGDRVRLVNDDYGKGTDRKSALHTPYFGKSGEVIYVKYGDIYRVTFDDRKTIDCFDWRLELDKSTISGTINIVTKKIVEETTTVSLVPGVMLKRNDRLFFVDDEYRLMRVVDSSAASLYVPDVRTANFTTDWEVYSPR